MGREGVGWCTHTHEHVWNHANRDSVPPGARLRGWVTRWNQTTPHGKAIRGDGGNDREAVPPVRIIEADNPRARDLTSHLIEAQNEVRDLI